MWRMLAALVLVLGALALVGLLYVRLAPSNPSRWHVDPLKAKRPDRPNAFLMQPGADRNAAHVFETDAKNLALAFDRLALSQPRVSRLAGTPEKLFTTYIARSPLIGFPDYISVRAVDLGQGRAALAIFSRARFGYSDLGVNKKRILDWLGKLAP